MEDIFKTNKAYLFQYRKKMEKIQRLEDKLAQIDSDLIVLKSPAMSSEPKSSVKITLTDKLIQREELEDKINTLLKYARQDRTGQTLHDALTLLTIRSRRWFWTDTSSACSL